MGRPIILVAEGTRDSQIIKFLLNTGDHKLFMVNSGGYSSISSRVRTLYLMYGDSYGYIAVFDSDSVLPSVQSERLSLVKHLSGADMHEKTIGVFCFHNTIESELGIPKEIKSDNLRLRDYLQEHNDELRQSETIQNIQAFIDELL